MHNSNILNYRDNEEDGLIEDVDEYRDENKGQDNEAFEGDQLNIV